MYIYDEKRESWTMVYTITKLITFYFKSADSANLTRNEFNPSLRLSL